MPKDVEINSATVKRMLEGDAEFAGVRAVIEQIGHSIASAAGDGVLFEEQRGSTRYRGRVYTATRAARANEAKNRSLTRAIDAGRA